MDIYKTNLFPYIEGTAMNGSDVTLTMDHVKTEELPTHGGKTEDKYVLYFKETDKGLILNKTNAKTIMLLHSKETDNWDGKQITLYATDVKAFGELHRTIRIRPAATNGDEEARNG